MRNLQNSRVNNSRIYSILISHTLNKSISHTYVEKLFVTRNLDLSEIYLWPRLATIDTISRPFRYELLIAFSFKTKQYVIFDLYTLCKVSKYVVFWFVFSYIRTEYEKIQTRKNSAIGHLSRSKYKYSLCSFCKTLE